MTPRYRRVADLFELTAMLLATATGVTLDQIAERLEVSHRTAERLTLGAREKPARTNRWVRPQQHLPHPISPEKWSIPCAIPSPF